MSEQSTSGKHGRRRLARQARQGRILWAQGKRHGRRPQRVLVVAQWLAPVLASILPSAQPVSQPVWRLVLEH